MRHKKALFLPGYFSNGFGHVSRCLAVAEELRSQGWKTGMVIAGQYAKVAKQNGCSVFKPFFPKRPQKKGSDTASPAYFYIKDGSMQVVRDGIADATRLRLAVYELIAIIRYFRPDVLVGDISLLTWILGQKTGIPVVQIIRSIMYPKHSKIIWWDDPPQGIVSPQVVPVINSVLDKWGIQKIGTAADLLQGDRYIVPSIPELEKLPHDIENTHFVGPLVRSMSESSELPDVFNVKHSRPIVYVTVGGGAGSVGSKKFFSLVNEVSRKANWITVVATGNKFDPKDVKNTSDNIYYYKWVPGAKVIQHSDAVVFPGGYGTMMEVIASGVPSVVVPFHSEQESNGRRLQENNVSIVLGLSSIEESNTYISSQWKYGTYTNCVRKNLDLDETRFKNAIEIVLENHEIKQSAKDLSLLSQQYRGTEHAVEIIIDVVE